MKKDVLFLFLCFLVLTGCTTGQFDSTVEGSSSSKATLPEQLFEERVWQQRIESALAQSPSCPPAIRPRYSAASYQGRLIDTHFHIPHLPDNSPWDRSSEEQSPRPLLGKGVTINDIICTLNQENTTKVFAFFAVFPEIDWQSVEVAKQAMAKYPDQIVPFIMPPDHDNDKDGSPTVNATVLQGMLSAAPGLFKGYGEIGLYARKGGASELPPNSQRLLEIYPVIREHGLLVYFHLGENHKDSFEEVLAANRDITFIFHGDQLSVSEVEDILAKHSNAYYTVDELYGDVWLLRPEVSKEEFLAHFSDYEPLLEKDLAAWKGPIERHPDQFMWGTDRGWSSAWSVDPQVGMTLSEYARAFIAGLDPLVQEKFAYKNAQRLLE